MAERATQIIPAGLLPAPSTSHQPIKVSSPQLEKYTARWKPKLRILGVWPLVSDVSGWHESVCVCVCVWLQEGQGNPGHRWSAWEQVWGWTALWEHLCVSKGRQSGGASGEKYEAISAVFFHVNALSDCYLCARLYIYVHICMLCVHMPSGNTSSAWLAWGLEAAAALPLYGWCVWNYINFLSQVPNVNKYRSE